MQTKTTTTTTTTTTTIIRSPSIITAQNKYVRRFGETGARQINLSANIYDTVKKCQLRSDPIILQYRRQPHCSRCGDDSHWTVSCPEKVAAPDHELNAMEKLNKEVETFFIS